MERADGIDFCRFKCTNDVDFNERTFVIPALA
jgi:hypothetical protein